MTEEVQVRPANRRTRSERTKRRERYLSHNGIKINKNDGKFSENYDTVTKTSQLIAVNNNNCLKCGYPAEKTKENQILVRMYFR